MIKRNGDNVFAIASSNNHCQGGRSAVSLSPAGGGGGAATRIPRATAARMTLPDAQHNTKEANIAISTYVEKWKNRYEESERKHKAHLLKAEKARREYDDLQRRFNITREERHHLECELNERERELSKLRNVSEKLFKEYQQLKQKNDVDAALMQKVMQQAGEWYQQNRQLKRRSTALLNHLPKTVDIDLTDCNDSESDSGQSEAQFLRGQVSSLSDELAAAQAELAAARLSEFEATEHAVTIAQELEQEKEKCAAQERELQELRGQIERHNRVSKLLVDEVTAIKENADKDRQMAETYKSEALSAKKRVKLLSRQSALLLGELAADERLSMLIEELDSLRTTLDNQAMRHQEQVEDLQLKLAEKQEDTDVFLWEEKIRLAEEDAQKALARAEKAEKRLTEIEKRMTEVERPPQKKTAIMSRINYFEKGGEKEKEIDKTSVSAMTQSTQSTLTTNISLASITADIPPPLRLEVVEPLTEVPVDSPPVNVNIPPPPPVNIPPPPPPPVNIPPPPPPPPPPLLPPPVMSKSAPLSELLAAKQGTLQKTKQNGGGAIDAIVDQIKGGKFHLKSTDQNFLEKKKDAEQPEAVKEMLAILGTLRKRRSVHRPSFVTGES